MSQERPSHQFSSRLTEEALPPTPLIMAAPFAPQVGLTDVAQPLLIPDRYWRLLNDPGLTPPILHPTLSTVSTEAFLGLSHQVQALTGMIQTIIPHIPQLT
ncbi:hypothetical protein BHM03_00003976 [Ensete ventricosum]|nr:hypothetical protein BHM03_00003976 [Ensete ventricosum]